MRDKKIGLRKKYPANVTDGNSQHAFNAGWNACFDEALEVFKKEITKLVPFIIARLLKGDDVDGKQRSDN